MQLITRARFLFRNLFRREEREADMAEELRGFERLLIEENVQAGMDTVQAERAARAAVGGVEYVKENVRSERSGASIEGLMQDVRYGARSLRRAPAFTIAAVVALALGIGASTAIFSVVNGVLLRPLPYTNPDELVTVLHEGSDPVSAANFMDWRRQANVFSAMAAAEYWSPNFSGDGATERIVALRLSGSMFPLLGVRPLLGRTFGEQAEVHRDAEVVISFRMWQQRYAGDSGAVGKTMLLDRNRYTIVGVMPRDFMFAPFWARDAEMWAPLILAGKGPERGSNSLRAFARLKPSVSVQAAQQEISSITTRLEREFPGTNADVQVTPLMQQATAGYERPLVVLMIAVSFLLIAACANVAHMMLARSSSRQREMAVRIAIGASSAKLARQLLTESVMLAGAGGVIGALLAFFGTRTLVAMSAGSIPRGENVVFDVRVLLVTVGVSLVTGVLFGLAPSRSAGRTELVSSLKDGGRSDGAGAAHTGFRHVLVASQFAIAMTLLVGAGLMLRTLAAMNAIDPGFNPSDVASAEVSVTGTAIAESGNRLAFYNRLREALGGQPGVVAAGAINHLPLAGDLWGVTIKVEGAVSARNGERKSAAYRVATPGYLAAMRIALEKGKDFEESDRMDATPVAIVNRAFADKYWPGEDAIGKRFAIPENDSTPLRWRRVIGVTRNVVRSNWTEAPAPEMYLPLAQESAYLGGTAAHLGYLTFVVRANGNGASLAPVLRRVVAEIDPTVSISAVRSMDSIVSDKSAHQRFYFVLLAVFAGAAIILAGVGIYGVMSHAVARRMHEMGVRIALGATGTQVMSLVVSRGMQVVLFGTAAGALGAFVLTRFMRSIIYGVRATDPVTFALVAVLLITIAFIACVIPARRATRADPIRALRGD